MTDVKKAAEDTREDTKTIKELIENLTKNVSNTDKTNEQRFTQMKVLFRQLMKSNMANLKVPTHGELWLICFCFVLNHYMNDTSSLEDNFYVMICIHTINCF